MSIRIKLILPIALLVVIFGAIVVIATNYTVTGLVNDHEQTLIRYAHEAVATEATSRKDSIYDSIDQLGKVALEQAALFSQLPAVQEAYAVALSGDINNEADPQAQKGRDMLRTALKPFVAGYKKQTGQDAFTIHFHLPNSRSLSRIWRDGWQTKRDGKKLDISDDLTSFRKTVVTINQGNHAPLKGIEIGRGGFALRGLSAISGPDQKHIGSCEVLVSFAQVLKSNHVNNNYQIAVYMTADMLPIATSLQDPAKNPVIGGKYVFTSSTKKEVTDQFITIDLLDKGREKEYQQRVGDKFISTFPVVDFSGDLVGVMALVYDMSKVGTLSERIHQAGLMTTSQINWRFGGGSLALIVIIIITISLVTRAIMRPLQAAVSAAKQVANGDLSATLGYNNKDEVGSLSSAINSLISSLRQKADEAEMIATGHLAFSASRLSEADAMGQAFVSMVDNLNDVLGEVQKASDQIDAGSQQVSDMAQALSQSATESAASLQEISSSINEVESQVKGSASNAEHANTLAQQAQDAAQVGSQRMTAMIKAMNEINEAGQDINKIIKVIDEIAFQTNLLALNAAVEAARAGQHGKGFAVVAEEVRNLAARSAKAADETAQLIEGSVGKAAHGTEIASSTAESLNEIVEYITKVTSLAGEIALASQQQAHGISQINQGLTHIDQAVQQNTATAEESAAASEELASQAAYLKRMLTRFELKQDVHADQFTPAKQVGYKTDTTLSTWGEKN